MTPDNHRLMIKAAKLYYENDFTQEVIADRLRISRPRVSRLLTEARETGIVQFKVAMMPGIFSDLEREMEARFDLSEAVVIEVSDPESHMTVARELGAAAADYFRRTVHDGDVIGLTWGETLAHMADNLPYEKKQNVTVVQMVGGLGDPARDIHATDIVRRITQKLDASMSLIPAPGIVASLETAALLKSERSIEQALQIARQADMVFAGIGAPVAEATYMRDESIITWNELGTLIERGAVGDIGLHFFDEHGCLVPLELNERIIGVGLETFRDLARVIGIAGGAEKRPAILGALRGRLVKTLITDLQTAQHLLQSAP